MRPRLSPQCLEHGKHSKMTATTVYPKVVGRRVFVFPRCRLRRKGTQYSRRQTRDLCQERESVMHR
jgi:hypothetical protein